MSIGYSKLYTLLLLILHLSSTHTSSANSNTTVTCLPEDAAALLHLKRSFLNTTALTSWQAGTDCFGWNGITVDVASRRVIALDLEGYYLMSRGLAPALFNLTALRSLNLAGNYFMGASLPSAGFERLTEMVHLNLSNTGFYGQIPIGIAQLNKLVALDFSCYYTEAFFLKVEETSFQTIIANMSSLIELHLDGVNISSSGEIWSTNLANSTPGLQILSLQACELSGSIDPSFSRLRSLVQINLAVNAIYGKVPDFFTNFSLLSTLDLSENDFEGQFPAKIFQLKSLRILDISFNYKLSGCLQSFPVGNKLEKLHLVETNFTDVVPNSMVNLRSLSVLELSTEGTSKQLSLIGKLPSLDELFLCGSSGVAKPEFSWIADLRHLTSLTLSNYNSPEPIPSWISNLTNLVYLELSYCSFYGAIPDRICNLTQLSTVDLTGNYLTGKIPKSLLTLPYVQYLKLNSNQLSGHIEDIDNPLHSSLSWIDLGNNRIGGSIPRSFFQLANLKYLWLDSNKLTGIVDLSSFWRLKNLIVLSLSNNNLWITDDKVDSLFPSLHSKVVSLSLASCNLTKFPGSLRYRDIVQLDLSMNYIGGTIPSWIWERHSYVYLNLSHNMLSRLEKNPTFVPLASLAALDLSFNRLEGNIPIPQFKTKDTIKTKVGSVLDFSNNNFDSIPPNFGRYFTYVANINLSKNKLNGHIPASICCAIELDTLELSYNYINGSVPSCLMQSKLRVLKLRGNQLNGALPNNIKEGCGLVTVDLNSNKIIGKLPRSLSNCQGLVLFDVSNNQIVDSFPSWLGILPNLRVLVLRSNQFFGTLSALTESNHNMSQFSNLQILDLASNNLSGNLPQGLFSELKSMMVSDNDEGEILGHQLNLTREFYRDTVTVTFKGFELIFTKILTTFTVIDLSMNSFDGPIPESLGKLASLHGLNMSDNNFTGQIPSQLGNLSRLESMDLSWNHLLGEIPSEFTSLTSLEWLNLSYNNLSGRIPQGNQFLSFPSSSFEGNAGLCGKQVPKQCDDQNSTSTQASDHPESYSLWHDRLEAILLFTFAGLGFGVGFALTILFQHFYRMDGWTCKRR